MKSITLIVGACYGLFSIILGAFGAHALKKILSSTQIETFETGVRYQMYAALYLLIIGSILPFDTSVQKWISGLMMVGCVFFSVSIYFLSFNGYNGYNFKVLGPITPIGGMMMIVSWAMLLYYFVKLKA